MKFSAWVSRPVSGFFRSFLCPYTTYFVSCGSGDTKKRLWARNGRVRMSPADRWNSLGCGRLAAAGVCVGLNAFETSYGSREGAARGPCAAVVAPPSGLPLVHHAHARAPAPPPPPPPPGPA